MNTKVNIGSRRAYSSKFLKICIHEPHSVTQSHTTKESCKTHWRHLYQNMWTRPSYPGPISHICKIQNWIFLFCPSDGSFVDWNMKKIDTLLSFQDIFTKIGGHLHPDLSNKLTAIIFICLCFLKVSTNFFEIFPYTNVTSSQKSHSILWFVCRSVDSFVH